MISLAWIFLTAAGAAATPDIVRFDFETGDLQGWQVVEGRFDYVVSDRPVFHNQYPDQISNAYNKQGRYYLSTVEQQPGQTSNDRMTGVIESPVFVLAGPAMSMLVGSGTQPGAYVALCSIDGREVLVARGKDQTEVMQRVHWDAPQFVGEKVFLRIVDRETGGWGHVTFDDFSARGRIDSEETQRRSTDIETRRARERLETAIRESNLPGLRRAIADLMETMPAQYPRGTEFLIRLDALEKRLAESTPVDTLRVVQELNALRREALVANPLVGGQPIVFVVRHQYQSHYHAIDTLFHTGELNADRGMTPHADLFRGGGALKTIDLTTGRVQTFVNVPDGVVRDPEVHFDGRRIVFALRRHRDEDYHIWEIQADGSGLRQLTGAVGVSDFDPVYLPDERIAFSSTREPKYNQCSRDHGANLFCMEPEGANIHQVSKNNLFDNHGTLTPDGRILYARWEYVDRNFGDAHGIWTVNPDGTNQTIYWGNNTASPGAVYYPRLIPGTQQMLCVFGMHHFRLWGALAIVDRQRGLDGREPVVRTWPADAIERVRAGGDFDCDGFVSVYPKYECPYPLSDKYFLCARMTLRAGQLSEATDATFGEAMGIYLIDVFGNELLLHVEEPGCYDPMPLRPQTRPPVIPTRRDFESQVGYFYVADVYRGTHMASVPRGAVKSLRVVESPEKRHWSPGAWFGQGYTAPAMNWHSLENKRVLGTVPVDEDGSASFAVPSETFVYFQLLDENGMLIQSMRSGANVQSGEHTTCVGCHEDRRTAPPAMPGMSSEQTPPLAWRRPPSRLTGWYGPPRAFSFMAEVQPVFDKHCVVCHDYGQEAGRILNLAPDRTLTFNTAYTELWRKGYLHCVGAGPAEIQPPYSWGSHASKLVHVLRTPGTPGHEQVQLTPEELHRIITWIDLNGVYYPTYACAYPHSLTGRIPLDAAQLNQLAQLTGEDFIRQRSFGECPGPDVSFDRPELSPLLARFPDRNDPKCREALAIIRAGQQQLARRPRADMPGFVPSDPDQYRESKFALRREIELENRAAIRRGDKVFDDEVPGTGR
ncbi:MAG: HzsA-related protein [Pirellulaceae bacterium]